MHAAPAQLPMASGPMAERLAQAAARGAFELPVCARCGRVQYPLRERCARCFHALLVWQAVDPTGTLVATSVLHRSNDPAFAADLPLVIGAVALDDGPTIILFVSQAGLPCGTRMRIRNTLGPRGDAILRASAELAARDEPTQ